MGTVIIKNTIEEFDTTKSISSFSFKKFFKIVSIIVLILLLLFVGFIYLLIWGDSNTYESESTSKKYTLTIVENCFFYCEQYATLVNHEDGTKKYCHLSISSEVPVFYNNPTLSWSVDEKELYWQTKETYGGTIELSKDCHKQDGN